jgi:hypothetical protein
VVKQEVFSSPPGARVSHVEGRFIKQIMQYISLEAIYSAVFVLFNYKAEMFSAEGHSLNP